jgi:hypothetical protein
MARTVKRNRGAAGAKRAETTRISSKHQVTIGKQAFADAGLHTGDVVQVRAVGPGKVLLDRTDELIARYSGALGTNGDLRARTEALRDEWD